jgi:polyisoprenoid-binding protein YceI
MATTATTSQTTTTTRWQLDPAHTLVELAAKHMMFTTVKGRFTGVKGTVTLDEADPSRSSVTAEIDATTITTADDKRDAHLRSADFLDVESYPTITFTSTHAEQVSKDRSRIVGDLTIRGVTREVVLDTVYNGRGVNPFGKEVIGFSAETTIHRSDFGLNWNVALEAGGVLVSDAIKITLDIQAVRQD